MAFEGLSDKLNGVFKRLRGKGRLTEADVREGMREVRLALLEADVSYKVVKDFVASVTEKCVGADVLESLTPAQQIIKVVNQELTALMGGTNARLSTASKGPTVVMMVGLQGAGKTTNGAKLAGLMRRSYGKRPLLVACDVYRPAAINQLQVVGKQLDIPVFEMGQIDPVTIAKEADYYGDMAHIEAAFYNFCSLLPMDGLAIGWGEDPRVRALFARLDRRHETFGYTQACDWYPADLTYSDHGCPRFTACFRGKPMCSVALRVAGKFNILNALAALASAHALGADMRLASASLDRFAGVHRRFEHTGDIDGVHMYHDYGHNPVEMRGALSVACEQHANHVWAVMQPHTYSRVKTLFDDYLTCTQAADYTLVTDIYAAREKDPGDINSQMLVDGMRAHGVNAVLTPTFDDTEAYLRAHWQPGDLVLTMGCGNINLLNEQMQQHGDTKK